MSERPAALVRLGLRATHIASDGNGIEAAREAFRLQHVVIFPDFLDADALAYVQDTTERDGFQLRVHEGLPGKPADLLLNPSIATGMLMLALNDTGFLDFARLVTHRADINSLRGSITRRVPGAGHGDAWHDDMVDGRVAVLSINLSPERYEGGQLQIREGADGPIVFEHRNFRAGDAVLFKLDPDLKHRVTPPEGGSRTVFAGFFRTQPARDLFGLDGGD